MNEEATPEEVPEQPFVIEGPLLLTRYGFGFLSLGGEKTEQVLEDPMGPTYRFQAASDDIYVSPRMVNEYNLKDGDVVKCTIHAAADEEGYTAAAKLLEVNGEPPA